MRKESLTLVLLSAFAGCGDQLTPPESQPAEPDSPLSPLRLVAEAANDGLLREATAELPPSFAARRLVEILAEVEGRALVGDLQGTAEALAAAQHLVSSAFRGKDRLFPDVVDLLLQDMRDLLESSSDPS